MPTTTTRHRAGRMAAMTAITSLFLGAAVALGGVSSASANPIDNPFVLGAVNGVTVDEVTAGSPIARWNEPLVVGELTGEVAYAVTVRDLDEATVFTEAGITATSLALPSLLPRTTYTIEVTPSAVIDGVEYVAVGNRTPFTTRSVDGAPPVAVSAVVPQIDELNFFSVGFTWQPPTVSPPTTITATTYSVRLTRVETNDVFFFDTNLTNAFFPELVAGAEYRFDLTATVRLSGFDGDYEVASQPVVVAIPLEPSLAVIDDITIDARAFDITASWQPPTFTGSVGEVSYIYDYVFSGPGVDTIVDDTETPSLTFTGLAPETTYELEIFAVAFDDNGVEFSEFSTQITTAPIRVDPVASVSIDFDLETNTITVSWPAAAATFDVDPSGVESDVRYSVLVDNVGERELVGATSNIRALSFSVTVPTLRPGDVYSADVTPTARIDDQTLLVDSTRVFATVPPPTTIPEVPSEEAISSLRGDLPVTYDAEARTLTADISTLEQRPGTFLFGYALSTPRALGWSATSDGESITYALGDTELAPGEHRLVIIDRFGELLDYGTFVVPAGPVPPPPGDNDTVAPPAGETDTVTPPGALADSGPARDTLSTTGPRDVVTAAWIAALVAALGAALTLVNRRAARAGTRRAV